MSLPSLPVPRELDHMIIKLLPAHDRFRLSLASRHYSRLVFSHEVPDINELDIYKGNTTALSKLAHKLVRDSELAHRIRSITFFENIDAQRTNGKIALKAGTAGYDPTEMNLLLNIVQTTRPEMFPNEVKVFVMDIVTARWDALVAFVLRLAINVEEVRLRYHSHIQTIEDLLVQAMSHSEDIEHLNKKSSITHFEIEGLDPKSVSGIAIPAVSSLRSLICKNVYLTDIKLYEMTNLQVLRLYSSRFIIGSHSSPNLAGEFRCRLEVLTIHNYDFDGSDWLYISQRLKVATTLHSLDIQGSRFIEYRRRFYQGLRKLASFGHLRTLRISLHMIFDHPSAPSDFVNIIPQSIVDLEIYVINQQQYWSNFLLAMECFMTSYDNVTNFPNLQTIALSFIEGVEESSQLSQMIEDLRLLQKAWIRKGIHFNALCKALGQTHEEDLLI